MCRSKERWANVIATVDEFEEIGMNIVISKSKYQFEGNQNRIAKIGSLFAAFFTKPGRFLRKIYKLASKLNRTRPFCQIFGNYVFGHLDTEFCTDYTFPNAKRKLLMPHTSQTKN